MGDMTIDDFRAAVRMSLQARSDLLESQITRWVNWAYRYISHPSFFRHEELRYAVAHILRDGDFMINMAVGGDPRVNNIDGVQTMAAQGIENAGIEGVTLARITQGPTSFECPSIKLVPGDARLTDMTIGVRGIPSRYVVRTGDVWLLPPAGSEVAGDRVVVRVWATPGPIETNPALGFPGYGAQKTVIKRIWDDVIVLLARWRGLVEMAAPASERAASFQEFQAVVGRLKDHPTISAEDWKSSSYELSLIPYQGDARG